MSNANANFQRALVAFSQPGSNTQAFKAALEKYLKQYNKTINQQVQNILIGTTFGNIKNRKTLLNRLAARTAVVAQRAAAAGAPSPSTENMNKRIRSILASYKEQYNRERGMTFPLRTNIQFSADKNFNKNRLGQILNSNYKNKNFVRNVKSVLGLLVAPPLPPKPLVNMSSPSVIGPVAPVLQTFPVSQNKLGEIQTILKMIRSQGINSNWQKSITRPYNPANINQALKNFEFSNTPFSNQNKAVIKNRLTR
jgi:hypothetical protein